MRGLLNQHFKSMGACQLLMSVNRYGKMQVVMTDAGSAFYSWNGINRFQKLLSEKYGVDQIKARSPRSNGKIENVNKQIEKEVLDVKRYAGLEEADHALEKGLRFYNFERTHLGWTAAYHGWFFTNKLIRNQRKTQRIFVTPQGDGAFAAVDIDTL